MKLAKKKLNLTLKNLNDVIGFKNIYSAYAGKSLKFGVAISSPLREKDRKPSFSIDKTTGRWKDFSTGESGDVVAFVRRLTYLGFREALVHIAYTFDVQDEFLLFQKDIDSINVNAVEVHTINDKLKAVDPVTKTELKVKARKIEKHDLEYWSRWDCGLEDLKWGRIFPISEFTINGKRFTADKYAYCYAEVKDKVLSLKVYQPFSRIRKWRSNMTFDIWELWDQHIETAEYAKKHYHQYPYTVICASRKDALAVRRLYKSFYPDTYYNYSFLALQGEAAVPKQSAIDRLNETSKGRICVLYDFDTTGLTNSKYLASSFGLSSITRVVSGIERDSIITDLADLVEYAIAHGKKSYIAGELAKLISNGANA